MYEEVGGLVEEEKEGVDWFIRGIGGEVEMGLEGEKLGEEKFEKGMKRGWEWGLLEEK